MPLINKSNIQNRFNKPPEYFSGKKKTFLDMVPKDARKVLDVGCGDGSAWREYQGEVFGIELNPSACQMAQRNLKGVFQGDIEKMDLPFTEGFFDCVVFGDVLEHLYDPWGILMKYGKLLRPGGHVLISIPNIRHYRVLRSLVFKGQFSYEESGILDIDHIRFFTLKEVTTMLQSTGFRMQTVKKNINASSKYKVFDKLFFGALSDFLTEQYFILATKNN